MKYKTVKIKMSIEQGIYDEILRKYESIEYGIEDILTSHYYKMSNSQLSSRQPVGILRRSYNNYQGKKNYTKDEFIDYISRSKTFKMLFKQYKKSSFDKSLMPSFILAEELHQVEIMTYTERMKIASELRKRSKLDKSK